jgi:hypothetical protein
VNKKIGFIVVSTLFLVTVLIYVPLAFAQTTYWDYAKVSAYGKDLDDFSSSTVNIERFEFTVVVPPTGSEITNTIEVRDDDSGENHTINLSIGDIVRVNYQNTVPTHNSVDPASEPNHVIVDYEGEVTGISINTVEVPEFSSIILIPLFMIATVLVIAYRRRRTS